MNTRSFPPRNNKKDNRHFFSNHSRPKPSSNVNIFSPGARHFLHPNLSILDSIDCELFYYKNEKIVVVDYEPVMEKVDYTDYTKKVYKKSIMSNDISFIVDLIGEYISERKDIEYNQANENNSKNIFGE
jgi:hypothetical protein